MTTRIALGKKGEALVAHYLTQQGFTILAMNYAQRGGEIDIIAQKKEVLAFVEVKMRSSLYFNISEVITASKQRKIVQTARLYISRLPEQELVYRFDVALIEQKKEDYSITYIPDAFTAPE